MPRFEWKDEDYKASLMFFPMVGVVIGVIILALNELSFMAAVPTAVRIILTILVPILVTGGFHLDGFMDTVDALSSYAERGRRLEILEDPHIGAFSVIGLVRWLLIYAAAVTAIVLNDKSDVKVMAVFCLTFVISRALSGLTSVLFVKARKKGMLYEETRGASRGKVIALSMWLVAGAALMIGLSIFRGLLICLAIALYTLYYRRMTMDRFGGVTGDTAGYYLTVVEAMSAVVLAISIYMM